VTTNTDQQQTRSDSASILKKEEEEEDESRTLRLKTGEAERPEEEEDADTDSEDTLGLLQQSKDLLTRHSMASIRMNHQDETIGLSVPADVNYLSVPVNNQLPLLIICLCLLMLNHLSVLLLSIICLSLC
jgi:hypothetical protein